jgi:hypothetical protein
VEPTNNAAERALRGPVLWRKGSRFVEAILTAVASCCPQGQEARDFLTACCQALRTRSRAEGDSRSAAIKVQYHGT